MLGLDRAVMDSRSCCSHLIESYLPRGKCCCEITGIANQATLAQRNPSPMFQSRDFRGRSQGLRCDWDVRTFASVEGVQSSSCWVHRDGKRAWKDFGEQDAATAGSSCGPSPTVCIVTSYSCCCTSRWAGGRARLRKSATSWLSGCLPHGAVALRLQNRVCSASGTVRQRFLAIATM